MIELPGLRTFWHLTDVGNLSSIFNFGIASRDETKNINPSFYRVGYDQIVGTRPQFTGYVLGLVFYKNTFITNRLTWHYKYHPKSLGLCLLEVDLVGATANCFNETRISNGNLAKKSFETRVGHLADNLDIVELDFIVDGNVTIAQRDFAHHAEILVPNTIEPRHIRRIWTADARSEINAREQVDEAMLYDGSALFNAPHKDLPPPAIQNFPEIISVEPTHVETKSFGPCVLTARSHELVRLTSLSETERWWCPISELV